MDKQVVHEFQKSQDERVLITVSDYKQKRYVDLRVFYSDPKTGETKPTKKGLTLPYALLPQLKNAIFACEKVRFESSAAQSESLKHSFTGRR